MRSPWVSVNGHVFNFSKAVNFSVYKKHEPYSTDKREIWQVRVGFGGGVAYDAGNEQVLDNSIMIAEFLSEEKGYELIADIIEGKYGYDLRRTTPPIPEPEKEKENKVDDDLPF